MPPTPPAPALDPTEVQVGTANGPGIWLSEPGIDPPEHTWDAFADTAGWDLLGYLSEDGPTVGVSTDSEDLTPWQSRVPIRSVITGRQITLQFVMWQLNETTLALYFDADPATPDSDGSIDMELRSDAPSHLYGVAIDTRDGDRVFRVSFGRASLSDAGDMDISSGAAVPLDVTLSALDDGGKLGLVQLGPAEDPSASNGGTGNGRRRAPAESAA
jgi:hypothetical protein